ASSRSSTLMQMRLGEFRVMLSNVLAAVICGTISAYCFLGELLRAVAKPLVPLNIKMISLMLSEGWMLDLPIQDLKFAFPAGIMISAPAIFGLTAEFLLRALAGAERRLLFRSMLAGMALYAAGVVGAYLFILPKAVFFFAEWSYSYSVHEKGAVLTDQYFAFVADFLLVCGLLCEVPFVLLVLAKKGLRTRQRLSWTRFYAIVLPLVILVLIAPNSEVSTFVTVALSLAVVSVACVASSALRGWRPEKAEALPP
ncbi:MAG TPA: twin-arginine translocase subunit TatC, partial [Chthoniobacteraceae bacterium]